MRKYGLIGYPLGHSFSKGYFAEKFLREKITGCSYENFPLTDLALLPSLIEGDPELLGLNVTIPYKSDILGYIDELDPEAAEIGAVNVLKIRRSGGKARVSGFNSDIRGISDSLGPWLEGINNALVLGTGGSSRAVCHFLEKSGIILTRVSRSSKPGIITYGEIDEQLFGKALLIVNTTPLGMFPDVDSRPPVNYGLLNKKHILFDLVYNPEITLFLRSGRERGCTIIPGLKMLHSQAERSWEIWNDEGI